jgi:hypothetical protein
MFGSNTYVIRMATDDDETALRRLSALDSQRRLNAPVLVGEIDGTPEAALSLADGRMMASTYRATDNLAVHLRLRASGLKAFDREPSLAARMRDAVRVRAVPHPLA